MEKLKALSGEHQLASYEDACQSFEWTQAEALFSWNLTGNVNMAYEAIDRHAEGELATKLALLYFDGEREERYTYEDMKRESNRAGNVLKSVGVEKGDRVFIFMPRSPELYFILLGTLKLGAIVGPLFEAFMEQAVHDRLLDSEAKVIVTTEALLPRIPVDQLPHLETILIVGDEVKEAGKIIDYRKLAGDASTDLDITWVDREDGMILHYTSGSTGKPKGVLHVHNAMVQHLMTGKWVLDLQPDDIYWCTADPGWVTGTSYGIFAPFLNGATNVIVGGRFNPEFWYSVIERFGVTVWY
ncbi:MAG: AMP-binding protein, partial [Exiguobacterium chiriqhucha]